jgi:hypothetical protein
MVRTRLCADVTRDTGRYVVVEGLPTYIFICCRFEANTRGRKTYERGLVADNDGGELFKVGYVCSSP